MAALSTTCPNAGAETNVYSRDYLLFLPLAGFAIFVGSFFILLAVFWPR
jgi:hypothetical protein